jgi:hypothetical protein
MSSNNFMDAPCTAVQAGFEVGLQSICACEAPESTASGDPHFVNVLGQNFDIFKAGEYEALRLPRESPSDQALLSVKTQISNMQHAIEDCSPALYITAVRIEGSWMGNQSILIDASQGRMVVYKDGVPQTVPSAFHFDAGHGIGMVLPRDGEAVLHFGSAQMTVQQDSQLQHFFFDIKFRGLSYLGHQIGGLLGEDDHVDVSTMPSFCAQEMEQHDQSTRGSMVRFEKDVECPTPLVYFRA